MPVDDIVRNFIDNYGPNQRYFYFFREDVKKAILDSYNFQKDIDRERVINSISDSKSKSIEKNPLKL